MFETELRLSCPVFVYIGLQVVALLLFFGGMGPSFNQFCYEILVFEDFDWFPNGKVVEVCALGYYLWAVKIDGVFGILYLYLIAVADKKM